jgi:hypothetical protein
LVIFSITPSPLAVHNAFRQRWMCDALSFSHSARFGKIEANSHDDRASPDEPKGSGCAQACRHRTYVSPHRYAIVHVHPPCSQPGWAAPLRPAACLVAAISRGCASRACRRALKYITTPPGACQELTGPISPVGGPK